MTTSEILIEQITNSVDDDATISAALDALREERGFDLLSAVMAVAAARRAGVDSREIASAARLIAKGSPIRQAFLDAIAAECSEVPEGAQVDITIVAGDTWPHGRDTSISSPHGWWLAGHVTVGAMWILSREATVRAHVAARRRPPRRRTVS